MRCVCEEVPESSSVFQEEVFQESTDRWFASPTEGRRHVSLVTYSIPWTKVPTDGSATRYPAWYLGEDGYKTIASFGRRCRPMGRPHGTRPHTWVKKGIRLGETRVHCWCHTFVDPCARTLTWFDLFYFILFFRCKGWWRMTRLGKLMWSCNKERGCYSVHFSCSPTSTVLIYKTKLVLHYQIYDETSVETGLKISQLCPLSSVE